MPLPRGLIQTRPQHWHPALETVLCTASRVLDPWASILQKPLTVSLHTTLCLDSPETKIPQHLPSGWTPKIFYLLPFDTRVIGHDEDPFPVFSMCLPTITTWPRIQTPWAMWSGKGEHLTRVASRLHPDACRHRQLALLTRPNLVSPEDLISWLRRQACWINPCREATHGLHAKGEKTSAGE